MREPAELARVLSRFGAHEPGVVVGVLSGGEVTGSACVGLASVEHGVPVSPTTVFDLASVSKHVTSTCLLLLEDDGLLSLDDDLRDHLPGMQLRHAVTLRQLAQHTSGLRDYMAVNALVGAGPASWRTEDLVVRQLRAYRDTDFAPGTQWSYSNTGYIALAAVVRAVAGRSLAAFAEERVLAPLAMATSSFQDDAGALVPGRASGYARHADGFRRADSPDEVVGDGGLLTNLPDLARWHAFLDDGSVLGAGVRDRLLERAVLADGTVLPYALGIEHSCAAGRPAVGHSGSIEGFRAHLLHLLGEGLGVAVLANRSDADVAAVARATVLQLLGPGPSAPPPPASPGPGSRAGGLWFAEREQTFVTTVEQGDGLLLELGAARVPFVPVAPGTWRPDGLGADLTLRIEGDRLDMAVGDGGWNTTAYDRVEVAVEPPFAQHVTGAYASSELGALAVLSTGTGTGALELAIGAAEPQVLTAVAPGLLRTPSCTVRLERDAAGAVTALLVSGGRMRAVRFERAPGAVAVGFPFSLGGPLPAVGAHDDDS